jgi:hypothetical protein
LALALSMVLMFVHFYVEQTENALLEAVDARVERELAEHFAAIPAGPDGQLIAVRQMAETMLHAAELLMQRQVELWRASMDAAGAHWSQMANQAGQHLQTSLSAALSESLKNYSQHLAVVEQHHAEQGRQQWEEMRQLQAQGVAAIGNVQTEISRQVEVLRRAVEATGEVTRLEDALNRNLASLAGAKHFEQTVLSLAAALNLLGARFSELPSGIAPVQLDNHRRASKAA